MATTAYQVAYRAGRCARCGPVGVVTIHCWLDRSCQPEPVDAPDVSRELAMRLVDWYRSNPSSWPTVASVEHA